MELKKIKWVAAAVFLWASAAQAGSVALGRGSRLWLEGDSTLHPFTSTATVIAAEGEAAPADGFPAGLFQPGAVKSFQVSVPVDGLRSGKAGLDRNMYGALKAAEHPVIRFDLLGLERPVDSKTGEAFQVKARGTLNVAGQSRDVVLEAEAREEGGRLFIKGKEELKMTDFGIKPPRMLMGAIKTKDEVTVHYEIFIDVDANQTTGGRDEQH